MINYRCYESMLGAHLRVFFEGSLNEEAEA